MAIQNLVRTISNGSDSKRNCKARSYAGGSKAILEEPPQRQETPREGEIETVNEPHR